MVRRSLPATNKPLDKKHTELLTAGKVDAGPGKYAYGFVDGKADGARWFGHGGGAPGMNGELRIFPETGYVIATLANVDPPAGTDLAEYAIDRLPLK